MQYEPKSHELTHIHVFIIKWCQFIANVFATFLKYLLQFDTRNTLKTHSLVDICLQIFIKIQ